MTKKELRFWSNWAFIIIVSPLFSISQFGISSSFHQFVTNPTEDELANWNLNITSKQVSQLIIELRYVLCLSALSSDTKFVTPVSTLHEVVCEVQLYIVTCMVIPLSIPTACPVLAVLKSMCGMDDYWPIHV